MFFCKLCEVESCYTTNLCEKCRRVKHLINLYGCRVYEVLEAVLVRKEDKQDNKINEEIKTEIIKNEKCLRNKTQIKRGNEI